MDIRHELVIPNDDLPFRMFIFEGREGNYKVTKHWHHSVEIFLVQEGVIDFYINNSHLSLARQDFVLVNSNEVHSIECPDPNITIVLQIPGETFDDYMGEEGYVNFEKKDEVQNKRLTDLVTSMFSVYEKQEYGYSLMVKSRFYELLYLLVTEFKTGTMDKEVLRQKKQLDKLSGVTQYMRENYDQELKLDEVAGRFGFSPTYLSRIFQKYAQVNYRTYLIDLRVKYAVRELISTGHEIGEIAMNHGFPDSRAFSKAFKKRYGCLPSEYRKNLGAGP
ncbi:AraC family transcriptional regulator [Clostridium sp. Marseille-P2415]|uniref:AraC family transcriptional regulator n=1 Tax=Clostridium sp. Marseille-P2415 TaxID=1805471 RepID=UPI00098847CB|nr:AraC family transcriptional regulator [Clostridium sp. Marseille-P2415]